MFLLIHCRRGSPCTSILISIHLMFLLIMMYRICIRPTTCISIHLMFLLISSDHCIHVLQKYFNTSHVSINRNWTRKSGSRSIISIHLMFLLIRCRHQSTLRHCNFNTSHVSINLLRFILSSLATANFNTSHVSINQGARPESPEADRLFQYILCFY